MRNRDKAFTLTEMLVVMGIIVLFLALAVPTIRVLTGSRSIGAAQNQLSAMLARAREEAIGLQEPRGVLFYLDPATGRVVAALVQSTPPRPQPTNGSPGDLAQVYVDLVAGRDFVMLPQGVKLQTVLGRHPLDSASNPIPDRYLGYNLPTSGGTVKVGGLILFDGNGRLVSKSYGLRLATYNPSTGLPIPNAPTALGALLNAPGTPADAVYDNGIRPFDGLRSSYGMVLFDGIVFKDQGFGDEDDVFTSAYSLYTSVYGEATQNEQTEEIWIDANATPLFINRYNGTLIKGE